MVRILLTAALIATALSCQKSSDKQTLMLQEAASNKGKFTNISFDSDVDPVCKMSLSDGIADTTRYSAKTYGFCAKGCKADFLANPGYYIH